MHNKERNARKTAELMHENCSYNLATVEPDAGSRCIKLPSHGSKEEFDPNEFFDPGIVRQCIDDETACQSYLKDKTSSTDRAEIDRFVQIAYFLKVKECSNSFSLPVVALHNNAINDTTDYRADKKPKTEFKLDIEKEGKDKDEEKLKTLKDRLVKRFSADVKKLLTETPGKTNIFRWCASEELSACHIGDPDHPDHVTWVTNRDDFDKLKTKDINVALQDDPTRLQPESMTDLSTLSLLP